MNFRKIIFCQNYFMSKTNSKIGYIYTNAFLCLLVEIVLNLRL